MDINNLYAAHNILIENYHKKYNYVLCNKQVGSAINLDNYLEDETKLDKCYRIPYTITNVSRIIAIGDIHGDFLLVLSSLYIANCINYSFTVPESPDYIQVTHHDKIIYVIWTGEKTHVVQIGDQIDRCRPSDDDCISPNETVEDEDSDLKILYFFSELHELALKAGGMVISLLGNHELMNIKGNMSYVSYKGIINFVKDNTTVNYNQGLELRKRLFSLKEQKLAKFIACTRLAAVIINKILFVHAGLLPKLAIDYKIKDINIILKRWLTQTFDKNLDLHLKGGTLALLGYDKKATKDISNKSYNSIPISQNIIKKLFLSKDSLLWTRTYGNLPSNLPNTDERCIRYVLPLYKLYDIQGMIIGHTPQILGNVDGINSTCNNSVWRIDPGNSKAFSKFNSKAGLQAQVLEILFDKNNEPIYSKLVGSFIKIN